MERTKELEKKIKDEIYGFFAEQCDVNIEDLNDETNIIEDISGDSLMFLQLLQSWKRDYGIDIDFRKIGKYMTKNPAETIGKTIVFAMLVIFEKEKFLELVEA